jgi:hypothetical protein
MLRAMTEPEPPPRDRELPPPWAQHPEIPSGSIGWRMGYGEAYLMEWHDWLAKQPRDRAQRLAYLRRHPPAPRTWSRTVAAVLEPDRDADDTDEDVGEGEGDDDDRLVAEGLVGDDVAMGSWEAKNRDPRAPWATRWHDESFGIAVRYGGRELTFWARWCARQRERGQLDAWLRGVPEPAPAWVSMREAVRDGAAPSGWEPASAWERLAVLLAAHGEAPPPWILGEPPESLRERYEDDSSYADAWCGWVYEAFDDAASWRAYLARHGGVPAQWQQAVERAIWLGG